MKKPILIIWLGVLFTGIIALFWYQEWIYQLPTPVPEGYQFVKINDVVDIKVLATTSGRPALLHFFNPKCPCSRFNIPHFKSLVRQYGSKVDFIVVVMSEKKYTISEIQNKVGENVQVVMDSTIARVCGVYSTPQAVIVDGKRRLIYRGNYNKSRYCTSTKTEYARMTLDSMLTEKLIPEFDQFALTAYGCQIPLCKSGTP